MLPREQLFHYMYNVCLYFPDNINVIRLPSRSQEGNTFENEIARVSGWGKTSDCESIFFRYFSLDLPAF